nr:acyltransferase family protein [Mixta sp. Marseille-Q2659]
MKTNRVELIDYLRLIAALGVILFHYTFNGIDNGKISSISQIPALTQFTKFGYLGVELFFMISGYVIFFSAKKKAFPASFPAALCVFILLIGRGWSSPRFSF